VSKNKKTVRKKLVKARIITIVILAFFLFLLGLLEDHPLIIEKYYSKGVYLFICSMMHPFFNLFPFSVGDILYLVVIGLMIYFFIRLIRLLFKKEFKQAGILALGVIVCVQVGMLAFYLLWGINYFRPSARERLKLADSDYTTAQLASLTSLLIDSANATRARLTAGDTLQSNKAIGLTATQAVKVLSASSANFFTYNPNIKLSLFTPLLNYIGTSGYYNPFTTEAQMNYEMPFFLRPFVACHEMSHQMGYGAEDEANFVGFLAGVKSNDRLLRYSAYHEAVDEFMHDLMMRDTVLHQQLKAKVSHAVHHDFKVERQFWLAHIGKIDAISSLFYDNFLKANNQPQGMMTYNRMIRLVMAWYYKGVK
jgi:hypothetical protein